MTEVNKIITPDEFYLKMKDTELKYHDDPEECHWQLDKLMCDTLESLGYGTGVNEIFLELMRWYS